MAIVEKWVEHYSKSIFQNEIFSEHKNKTILMIKTKLVNFKALVLSEKHDIESRVRPLKQSLTMLKKNVLNQSLILGTMIKKLLYLIMKTKSSYENLSSVEEQMLLN